MKIFKRFLCLFLVVAVSVSLLGCCGKYRIKNDYNEIYNREQVSIDLNNDGFFTILKINDTHFINGINKKDKSSLELIKSVLDNNEYDFVIVDGDMVEGYNKNLFYNKYKAAAKLAELIESHNVLWTFAPGNNDGEKGGSNEDMIAFLMQYKHFVCGNEKDIDGSIQFFVYLKSNGKTVHSIAVLDSHSHDENGEYDHIKDSQIKWLLQNINEKKVKTSVFFHMPTPAFKTAYEKGQAYEGFPFCDQYAVDDIKKNAAFDEAVSDNELISLISVGHVHSDNIAYFYNNRYYQLSSLGGYNAVGSNNTAPSYTIIKIDTNAENNADMYEFSKVS